MFLAKRRKRKIRDSEQVEEKQQKRKEECGSRSNRPQIDW